ncbi:MAG: carboxylesterase [Gammaproteobacteria bacterium]|nr:carboxylesterase [Gammaproteobacteria bacterium]
MPSEDRDSAVVPAVEYVQIETGTNPTYSVIWLHGLGADGRDFEPIVPILNLSEENPVRFIFPHAPIRSITVNGGMEMRGWYDIKEWSFNRNEDEDGLEQSRQIVHALIEQENNKGVPCDRILLAGFSQGGAVALFTGLRYAERLAGIIALSSYLPVSNRTVGEKSEANQNIPIFMGHGSHDETVPVVLAGLGKDKLMKLEYQVEWHNYPMGHSVHPDEVDHIANFMRRVFAG